MPELKTLGTVLNKITAPYEDAQSSVLSRRLLVPPTSPGLSDRYIVPVAATGAWFGKTNNVARRNDTNQVWLFVPASTGMSAWIADEGLEAFFNGTVWIAGTGAEGVRGIVPVASPNRRMPGRPTIADGDRACDVALAFSPAPGSLVRVYVNGVHVAQIGDQTKLNCACYWSADGGHTPRRLIDVRAGDILYWCGTYARYQIRAYFELDFIFEVA